MSKTPPEPTEAPARRGLDPELQAVAKIDRILSEFDEDAVERMMVYLHAKRLHHPCPPPVRPQADTWKPVGGAALP